jgi:hypothetical protein
MVIIGFGLKTAELDRNYSEIIMIKGYLEIS